MTTVTPDEQIDGFAFRDDRAYDAATGMWVQDLGGEVRRVGINALTADAYGALAQLVIDGAGPVYRGEPFGSLEAAKFVGPLTAPISGTLCAVNAAVLEDPELVLRSPYEAGWLVEIAVDGPAATAELLTGAAARDWFARSIAEHRRNGLIAE
jgi:glycine cleavage system H protein